MTERWRRIEELFHRALECQVDERARFLEEACGGDEALRREVESLVAAEGSAAEFLETPILEAVARSAAVKARPWGEGLAVGAYRIVSPLGAGGMAEVYRARDTKLGRDVAIKTLPEEFARDPERVGRLEREAQLLASLNHPNIAAIHGLEEAGGGRFLILELVEGETLAERLERGPIPLQEALPMGLEIARALEAAHEKGVIHRDVKPANIKITPEGRVKVLDFGLAKAFSDGPGPDLSKSPAIDGTPTAPGALMGTPAYMSPEQARGRTVDKRADIWAFGCVLYEMLTGRRAFEGETVLDSIAAILQGAPDWSALPAKTPSSVRRVLERSLAKDSNRRLRDIGDARIELEEALTLAVRSGAAVDRPGARRSGSTRPLLLAALLAGAGLLGLVGILSTRGGEGPPGVLRLTIALPADRQLDTGLGAAPLALSPDGRTLVYAAANDGGATQLYVRRLDAFDPQPIPGTEGGRHPFLSPDGRWAAFFVGGELKRVALAGGAPVRVAEAPTARAGAAWGPDDTIVFDGGPGHGLMRVPAAGGRPEPVIPDRADGPAEMRWPQFLPGGRFLVVTVPTADEIIRPSLALLSLETGAWFPIAPGSQGQYVPPGYLVYHAVHATEGELHAVAFDPGRRAVHGEPFALVDGVFQAFGGGSAYFAVSPAGALVFAPGGLGHTLVRVDRNGRRTPLSDDRRGFRIPKFSPDGRRLAVTIDPRPSEIWIYDIERRSRSPLATDGHNMDPVWTPDGRRVAYSSNGDIHWKAADGSGPAERLLAREFQQYPNGWSPDGRLLLFMERGINRSIWALPLGGQPWPVVTAPAEQQQGVLSPDGRWLAYDSDESGRFEVSVRPFPNVDERRWVVSTAGGRSPLWAPDGREIFYMNGPAVMAVAVETHGEELAAGTPVMLFSGPFDATQFRNYDISPDGDSFVMIEADPDTRPSRLHVIVNWIEELEQRVTSTAW